MLAWSICCLHRGSSTFQHVSHDLCLSAQPRHAQVKSYLSGNPAISLALNDNLAIGRREGTHAADYGHGYGSDVVMLDDCNFHQAVSLDRFDSERTLELKPPDGEFALMNYRWGPTSGTASVACRGSSGLPGYQVCAAAYAQTPQEQTLTVAEGSSLLHHALAEMSATLQLSGSSG